MAKNASRPGRRLIVFALIIAAMYGAVALAGEWKPKLGLDLQGGTRITLEASTQTGEEITPDKLEEARGIIDQRVNGQGVAEAEVAVQGNRNIVVEIPGDNRRDLVDDVQQTAQLRFRLVAASAPGRPSAQQAPASPSASPDASPSNKPSGNASADPSPSASPRGRALSGGLVAADEQAGGKGDKNDGQQNGGGNGDQAPGGASPSAEPASPSAGLPGTTPEGAPVDQPLRWQDNPGDKWLQRFAEFTCPEAGEPPAPVVDNPNQPLVTCDDEGIKYTVDAPDFTSVGYAANIRLATL